MIEGAYDEYDRLRKLRDDREARKHDSERKKTESGEKMTHLYSIYLGTEQGTDGPVSALHRARVLYSIRRTLSDAFGGWSQHELLGGWIDNDQYIIERSIRIDIMTDAPKQLVREVALEAGAALQQKTVLLTCQPVQCEFIEVVLREEKNENL